MVVVLGAAMMMYPVRADQVGSRGPSVFQQCANCHSIEKDGGHKFGPNLHGIIGREVASLPGYDYSDALKAEGGVWTMEKLNAFLARPKLAVSGTHMPYRGVLSPHDREDLLLWLQQVQNGEKEASDRAGLDDTLAQGDAEHGQRLFRPCTVCHTYTKGDGNKIGPNLHGVYGRAVASAPGFFYSDSLNGRGGVWTAETLNVFMFEDKRFEQGSHMAFKALKKPEDRADLIAWLKSISPDKASAEAPSDNQYSSRR